MLETPHRHKYDAAAGDGMFLGFDRCTDIVGERVNTEFSMGWVDPRVGLGWAGLGWVEIFSFLVGWVGSWVRNISKNYSNT